MIQLKFTGLLGNLHGLLHSLEVCWLKEDETIDDALFNGRHYLWTSNLNSYLTTGLIAELPNGVLPSGTYIPMSKVTVIRDGTAISQENWNSGSPLVVTWPSSTPPVITSLTLGTPDYAECTLSCVVDSIILANYGYAWEESGSSIPSHTPDASRPVIWDVLPTTITFTQKGTRYLHVWVKDYYGNIATATTSSEIVQLYPGDTTPEGPLWANNNGYTTYYDYAPSSRGVWIGALGTLTYTYDVYSEDYNEGIAEADLQARLQVSTNDGSSWSDVFVATGSHRYTGTATMPITNIITRLRVYAYRKYVDWEVSASLSLMSVI